jgi:hypothetical protein
MGWLKKNVGKVVGTAVLPGFGTLLGAGYDYMNRDQGDPNAAENERLAQMEQQRQASLLALRNLYGVGDSAEAKAGAGRIQGQISGLANAQHQEDISSAMDAYGGAEQRNRWALLRRGVMTSGPGTMAGRQNLQGLLKARQSALTRASQLRQSAAASLDQQRLGLESQINSGGTAPDQAATMAQQGSALTQARSQIPQQQLGNFFKFVGDAYQNNAVSQAQGQGNRTSSFWGA